MPKYLGCSGLPHRLGRELTFQKLNAGHEARFLKASEKFRARKAIFSSTVSRNKEEYLYDGSFCTYEEYVNRQLCNHKVRDFAITLWVVKRFRIFGKDAPARSSVGVRRVSSLYLGTVRFTIFGIENLI